jgi:adenylate cyclase
MEAAGEAIVTEAGRAPARARERFRPRIAATLMLAFGALLVIAVGAVLLITLGTARVNTRDLLREAAGQRIDAVVAAVAVTLAPARAQAEFLATLIGSGKVGPEDDSRLETVLLGALAAAPQVSGVAFLRKDGHVVRASRSETGFDTAVSGWRDRSAAQTILAEALQVSGPRWGDIVYVPELGDTQVVLYAPVRHGSRFLGAVSSVVSIANLSRMLSGTEGSAVAFIIDDRGRVLAHPTLIGGPRGVSREKPLMSLAEIGDPILEKIWNGPGRTAFASTSSDSRYAQTVEVAGEQYSFLYRRIDEYGEVPWLVGTYQKSTLDITPLDRIRWAALSTGGILLAAVLVSLLLSRAILRPVQELAAGAAAVGRLDFSAIPPLRGAAFREVDAAMRAFNAMLAALRLFTTYVPRTLVRKIVAQPAGTALRPEEREVSVLFTDIVGFTGFAARLTPLRLAAFLNRHFALLGAAIEAQDGTIDKYIGDSVMAFWGAPDRQADHAARACRAALAIKEAIRADNARRAAKGRSPVRLRIGLHSGPALVGNIGAPGRINYTLVGDTVNAAQRLEQLGRRYAGEDEVVIIASRAVIERAALLDRAQSLGPQDLRGRRARLEVYRLG